MSACDATAGLYDCQPLPLPKQLLRCAFVFALVCAALSLSAAVPAAGSISFRRVVIPDDVPAHLTTALAQDASGFLWIGTQGGLVRYDGYGFVVYRSNPADASTISGSYVRSLLVAHDGRIWIGTFSGGVSVLDPATDRFTRYRHDARDPASLLDDRVEALVEDRRGRIWIATNGGVDRLDFRTGRFTHFVHDDADATSLADNRVRGLLVDRHGVVWVGSGGGLQRWSEARGFERIAAETLGARNVNKLFEDSAGRIWIGSAERGAAVLDPRSGAVQLFRPQPADPNGLSHFWVYGFAEPSPGEIWIATFGGGIDVVDARTMTIVDRLRHDATLADTIGADRVGAILRDRRGVIWVGSWGEGLALHDPSTRAFRTLRFSPSRPDGLTHQSIVRALGLRDGRIFTGTNGNGIDVLDANGHRVDQFRPNANDPAALSDGAITCLAEDSDGTVWVATLNGALHRLPRGSRRFERFTVADGLPGGPIRTIAPAGDGSVWIGAAYGMSHVVPQPRAITTWRHSSDASSLSGAAVESIVITRDGLLWVGTDGGLDRFDPRRGVIAHLRHDASRRDSLPDNWAPDLMLARDGRLWVGTQGGAALLTSFDGTHAAFDIVATRLGIAPAPAEQLIEDDRGFVWIGPRLRVDPKRWTAEQFGPADGVAFRNFFIASRARTSDGRLLFGSPEGLLIVDPSRVEQRTSELPIVPTSIRIGTRAIAGSPQKRALTIAPPARSFAIDFAALDLARASTIRYRYQLAGFDRDWTLVDDAHRSAAYTRLAPGTYEMRIEAAAPRGEWSRQPLRVAISVLPAWYETLWFRIGAGLLLAVLLYLAYRVRVHRLRIRSEQLEGMVAMRTRELAAAYERIEQASLTDPLTQLRNRRYLEQTIGADLELVARKQRDGEKADLLFILLDLDHFKSVNDTYGHAAGDAVLVQIAALLRATFRGSDSLVRWGGEEFLVVVRFVDRIHAPELAEKLRAAIEAHAFALPDGTLIRRTGSIGWSAWPFAADDEKPGGWEPVVDVADAALYAAKHGGRNAWVGVVAASGISSHEAIEHFRDAPAEAVAQGFVTVRSSRPVAFAQLASPAGG